MKAILRSGFFALAIMALAVPAHAGPFEDGLAAYNRGDYATALQVWRPLAEQGDARAQFNLSFMYEDGRGVSQNYAEAVKWYRRAALQGWALAEYSLGQMHRDGQAVPQDYAEAAKWYRKAAEQGNAYAQYSLGLMYHDGVGAPQDIVQAHMWFDLAAAQGNVMAQENRNKAANNMTPDQIAEAQRMAREWMERHQQ